jgi:arsenite-transporting ATPase
VKDFMEGMGLGGWVEQLGELKLGELLDTPPPGKGARPALLSVSGFGMVRVGGSNQQVKLTTS